MTSEDELRRHVEGLELELGEAVAARRLAEEHLAETEHALRAAHETIARLGDPLFEATFDDVRRPEVRRLRRRVHRLRARNERLRGELAQLRATRAVRWSAASRRLLRRVRSALPGPRRR